MARPSKYPRELRERAVRMVSESVWSTIRWRIGLCNLLCRHLDGRIVSPIR